MRTRRDDEMRANLMGEVAFKLGARKITFLMREYGEEDRERHRRWVGRKGVFLF